MKRLSQKLVLNCKKDVIAPGNGNQYRQVDEESGQSPDGLKIGNDQLDREELDISMQAASQTLHSTRGITGKQLKNDNPDPSYWGQLTASVLEKLSTFTDQVQKIADAHPYSKIAWMIISSAVTVISCAQDIDQNILDLFQKLDSTFKFIQDTKDIESHPSYERILTNLAKQTVECAYFIRDYAKMSKFWIRVGKNLLGSPIKARIKIYQDAFDSILTDFRNHSVLHSEIAVGRLLERNESISEILSLGKFPYAAGAGLHTGKKCLPGTRAEILDDIINWINDVDDNCPKLFWLAGPAGIGKSAIAHSVALWFQSIGRLGSFFCFDRNHSTERREKVFSTIARDLADLDVQIKRELVQVVQNKTSLQSTTDLRLQWTNFIFEPLQAISKISTGPILVVIDALDESGDPISRQELLKVLAKETSLLPSNIRFLVTSRPEQDISAAFRGLHSGCIRSKMMDCLSETETKLDIFTYFKTNLVEFGDSSFGDPQLTQLAELSQGLFQWAHLALQFLRGLGNTAGSTITERYEDLVNFQRIDSIDDNLDAMYTQILSSLFNTKQPRVMTRFRSVIGSIIAASEPLSLNSLVALRRGNIPLSQRQTDIRAVIQYMGSVLSGINDQSSIIYPLHLSFLEYLLDKDRSGDFYISLSQCHQDFAFGCLRTMNEGLRFNICDITNSHRSNADDQDLPARISSRISETLSYSSRFWGLHVFSSAFNSVLAKKIEEFLHQHFLHWLEVMSLLRTVPVAARSMSSLISWSSGKEIHKSLHELAVDGNRFIRVFSDAITVSMPHIYLSALPFCPKNSIIYKIFIRQFPNTLRVASGPIRNWPLNQRTMGLSGNVTCLCFSHKGEYLAVGFSEGILRLFNSESFDVLWSKELSVLEEKRVESIQFLPDDKSLVLAIPTGIYSMDILTGGIKSYKSLLFSSISFSPDAKFVVTLTFDPRFDPRLTVWNLETDQPVFDLLSGSARLPSYSFLDSNSCVFVTYFFKIGVQVWDLETGAILYGPFVPPSHLTLRVNHVIDISPNGKHIIFLTNSNLALWNFRDDSMILLDKPNGGSLIFSPDGNCVITQSSNGRLSLQYLNGNKVHYETDRGVTKVACSKDGRRLAVRSDNHLVIWELDGWQSTASDDQLEPHPLDANLLDTSSDGKYFIISTSKKEFFEVWDVQSGQSIWKISRDNMPTSTQPSFSPRNRYIGYILKHKLANVYDMHSRTCKKPVFGEGTIWIQGLAFSQDEKRLAALSITHEKIYIWDIDLSRMIEILTIPGRANCKGLGVFRASSNFRYFAYTLFDAVTLMDRMGPIYLKLPTPDHGELGYEVFENFAFGLDEEYMLVSRGSTIVHINLTTKEHRVVTLQHANNRLVRSMSLGRMRRLIYITPTSSEALLVEINSRLSSNVWDAFSGQHLYCTSPDEYPRMSINGFIPVHRYLFTTTRSDGHARVSTLEQKMKNRICFSSDDRHSLQSHPGSSAKFREDGWVVTQDDELLFWVPKDYHSTLHVPGLVYILGKNSLKLDLSSFSHGESWIACKSW